MGLKLETGLKPVSTSKINHIDQTKKQEIKNSSYDKQRIGNHC